MTQDINFTWNDARDFANQIIFATTSKYLSDLEIKVLQGAWENKTYEEIASLYNYGAAYLNRDVGNPLWKKLSKALNEKVSKTNFREALRRAWQQQKFASKPLQTFPQAANPTASLPLTNVPLSDTTTLSEIPFAEGPVPPDSPFYIERSNAENVGFKSIVKPGALIRVKAPNLMGKTSFLYRLSAYANQQNYPTVYLDLRSIDRQILTDLEKLLRWICSMVSRQLNLSNQLNDYWDSEIFGSNDNCTAYFEEYLLQQLEGPLVLGLDNIDRVFPYPEIVEDFFGMLRSWHEKGRISPTWQKLRLILVHSTEVYIPLNYHQSPFNTGIPIELPEFNADQICQIAKLHQLALNRDDIAALMETIGGHPYLVRLAIYELRTKSLSLAQLLEEAPTEAGIYNNHLRRYWVTLQQDCELMQALSAIINASEPITLSPVQTYKLHSMGLIQHHNNRVVPRCGLYQQYFHQLLKNH